MKTLLLLPFLTLVLGKEVTQLPGLHDPLNFRHYSGYLDASPTHKLHYWFTESQRDPVNDPFILWMNGGPGCSSLDGLLSELGPFHIRPDARTIYLNPHAWNKGTPAGVGFSYSTDGNVTTDDDLVALENYAALKDFFTREFPQYRANDFYVTGESYGGVYVPTLVTRILDGQKDFHINIKGMAVGNGLLSNELNTNTILNFLYNHGIIDQKLWELVETSCCGGCSDTCNFAEVTTKFCTDQVANMSMMGWAMGLNVYDLYGDCYTTPNFTVDNDRYRADIRHISHSKVDARRFFNLKGIKTLPGDIKITVDDLVATDPPCLNSSGIILYLNQRSVREALGIPVHVGKWLVCSDKVSGSYKKVYEDQYKNIHKALNSKLRILIYNGDTDMACNFLMGQQFCHKLRIPMLRKKTTWNFNHQIAGWITRYQNLDFVTVRGAGHMVPQWRAPQAFHMISAFLNDRDY